MTAARYSPANRIGTKALMPHNRVETETAALDGQSAVALAFITFWVAKHESVRPAPLVVIRRALQLLAAHLSVLEGDDMGREGRAFLQVAKGSGSALSLTQARARIDEHIEAPARQPMTTWMDALYSQRERQETAALIAHLESTMERFDQ